MAEPRRKTEVRASNAGAAAARHVPAQRRHPADALRVLIDRLDEVHAILTGMPATHAAVELRRDELRAVAAEIDGLTRWAPATRAPLCISEDGLRAGW